MTTTRTAVPALNVLSDQAAEAAIGAATRTLQLPTIRDQAIPIYGALGGKRGLLEGIIDTMIVAYRAPLLRWVSVLKPVAAGSSLTMLAGDWWVGSARCSPACSGAAEAGADLDRPGPVVAGCRRGG